MLLPPLFQTVVAAGFPSPAEDWIEGALDLNQLLIKRPAATFYLTVKGDSMQGAGIYEGDILIVDRSMKPAHGKIVIASVQGDFTVKRLHMVGRVVRLVPENPDYPSIEIHPEMEFRIFGVVTSCIHRV